MLEHLEKQHVLTANGRDQAQVSVEVRRILRHRQQFPAACEGAPVRERVRHPELRTHLIDERPQLRHGNTVRLAVLPEHRIPLPAELTAALPGPRGEPGIRLVGHQECRVLGPAVRALGGTRLFGAERPAMRSPARTPTYAVPPTVDRSGSQQSIRPAYTP